MIDDVLLILKGEVLINLCCDMICKVFKGLCVKVLVSEEDVLFLFVLKVKCCVLVEVVKVFVYIIFNDCILIEMVEKCFLNFD